MSFWGGVKKGLGAVGDVAKKVAPLTTFIPGVGPVAAGLIGAAGAGLGKLNDENVTLGNTLGGMAGYGALGYGGAKGLDALHLGGAAGGLMPKSPGIMPTPNQGGGGMDFKDWLALGTAGAGALAGGYGAYQQGKQGDAELAESKRRYDQDFAFGQQQYADQRADLAAELERKRRSGVALNPMLAGLLGRSQAVQMGS